MESGPPGEPTFASNLLLPQDILYCLCVTHRQPLRGQTRLTHRNMLGHPASRVPVRCPSVEHLRNYRESLYFTTA